MLRRHLIIEHDHINHQWRCDLRDGVGTVVVTDHLWQMEQALDKLENDGRLCKEVSHVGTEPEGTADDRDWRGHEAG